MISWDFVLTRVKEELTLPFQMLEKTDEEIVDYFKRNTVKKFSRFFPAKFQTVLDTTNPDTMHPTIAGQYLLVDPDNREILNILAVHPTMSKLLILGHPYIGVFNYDSIEDYQLAVNKANALEFWSPYHYTYQFYPPNILRILPDTKGQVTVIYERQIDPELSDIKPELEDDFIELCLAMLQMNIGRLRKRYNNIQTPFGEISLSADDIYTEGKQMYDQLMDKFDQRCLASVTFDRG